MFKRKEWVANPADPTQVIQWEFHRKPWQRFRWISVTLTQSWGIESSVRIFGRTFRGHDQLWAVQLFSFLEQRWEARQMEYDLDPMGRLSDYE